MRKLFTTIILLWLKNIAVGQTLLSGAYNSGLILAYDSITKKLTGYFENYIGMDEETGNPKFSCIFYIQGTITGSQFPIETYYPNDTSDIIKGNMQIIDNKTAGIKLDEEHGGCWNVQHFAEYNVKFTLEKQSAWTQIRYISIDKSYFHTEKSNNKKQKSYVVKNDLVFIDKIDGEWALCKYYGKIIKTGWVKTVDLNKL